MNLRGAVPVSVAVYDLTGRQVGGFGSGSSAVKRTIPVFPGMAAATRDLLAPGLYLLQLEVETDAGRPRKASRRHRLARMKTRRFMYRVVPQAHGNY